MFGRNTTAANTCVPWVLLTTPQPTIDPLRPSISCISLPRNLLFYDIIGVYGVTASVSFFILFYFILFYCMILRRNLTSVTSLFPGFFLSSNTSEEREFLDSTKKMIENWFFVAVKDGYGLK